ncbi:protein disulfide oxidoreductase [Vibrio sp.]|nr:protein disulfide oxidoreductase [Vibrio sp.]
MQIHRIKKWTKTIITYSLFFAVISWGIDYYRGGEVPRETLPVLMTTTVQGESVDLMALSQDQAVVVYFWATWCVPCKTVTPTINWLSDHLPVVSVALSSGEDERLTRYLTAKGYDFPVINDNQSKISREWGISITPTILIVKDGKVTSLTTGFTTPFGILYRYLTA